MHLRVLWLPQVWSLGEFESLFGAVTDFRWEYDSGLVATTFVIKFVQFDLQVN